MLEIVGEPELSRRFVAGSHPDPELHGDDIAGVELLDDDSDAVREDPPRGHGPLGREEARRRRGAARAPEQ